LRKLTSSFFCSLAERESVMFVAIAVVLIWRIPHLARLIMGPRHKHPPLEAWDAERHGISTRKSFLHSGGCGN
jgi:hypothetical protein